MKLTIKEYEEKQRIIEKLSNELKGATIIPDNPFNVKNEDYAYLNDVGYGITRYYMWSESYIDEFIPCKDKSIVEARQRRHRLTDLLEKFAYDNDAVVTEDMWEDVDIIKYYIYYNFSNNDYEVHSVCRMKELSTIHFTSREATEKAIKEVVIPFNEGMRNI